MIKSSLDWPIERQNLKEKINALPYNPDLHKMLKNIDAQIDALSKAEVIARRNHKKFENLVELKTVNDSLVVLEKWIIMAALIN